MAEKFDLNGWMGRWDVVIPPAGYAELVTRIRELEAAPRAMGASAERDEACGAVECETGSECDALGCRKARAEKPHNPWRESLENCANGDNYLRSQEYIDLADYIDSLLSQPEPSREVEDARDAALREIKSLVCGDRIPRWDGQDATTWTRHRIADLCDAAMSASKEGA